MNVSETLVICLLVTSSLLVLPNVNAAQTTRIYELVSPIRKVAGSLDPFPVTAIVFYNDTSRGYFLTVGISDADKTTHTIVPGIATSSPDPCINPSGLAALCIIKTTASSGAEQIEFKIGGILGGERGSGTWNLNITTALFDSNSSWIPKSTSSVIFGVQVTPVPLRVIVPRAVTISVDGVKQAPGTAEVGVALGKHDIAVPAIAQVNPTTRLRFDRWSDGLEDTNRTVLVNSAASFEAIYVTQYLLTLAGPQSRSVGAGWYDSDAQGTFSVETIESMSGLLGILGGKLKFQGWYEDGKLLSTSTTGTISMTRPHTLTAVWQADYSVPFSILSTLVIILSLAYLITHRKPVKPTRHRRSRSRRKQS